MFAPAEEPLNFHVNQESGTISHRPVFPNIHNSIYVSISYDIL